MGRIIATTDTEATTGNDADDSYGGIRTLAHITDTNEQIDENPLFTAAESYVISVYPSAPDATGETRTSVILALQFITAYYFLRGHGGTADTTTTRTGEVRSETERLGSLSETTSYESGTTTGSTSRVSIDSRVDLLKDDADAILARLGGTSTTSFGNISAVRTIKSRLGN